MFSHRGTDKRLGVAIGDHVLDLCELASDLPLSQALLTDRRGWNGVMESGPPLWKSLRSTLIDLLHHDARPRPDALLPLSDICLHMPFEVAEFTDFFSCENHAINAGRIYRGDALQPAAQLASHAGWFCSTRVLGRGVRHRCPPTMGTDGGCWPDIATMGPERLP